MEHRELQKTAEEKWDAYRNAGRQEKLLKSISSTQTFLTCTGMDDFVRRSINVDKKWRVAGGTLILDGGYKVLTREEIVRILKESL